MKVFVTLLITALVFTPPCHADENSFVVAVSHDGYFQQRGVFGLLRVGNSVCRYLRLGVTTDDLATSLSEKDFMSVERAKRFVSLSQTYLCPETIG